MARRHRSVLIDIAAEQVARLGGVTGHAGRMLHGEALIITGVLAAIVRVVTAAMTKIDRLAKRHDAAVSDLAALNVQLAQLPQRQQVVAPAHHGRPRQLASVERPRRVDRHVAEFLSRMAGPKLVPEDAVYGDAVTTTAAAAQHAVLNESIATDDAAGQSRHHHHVARVWRRVALAVLFFDVVALTTLTIKLENVSFDLEVWHAQFAEQAQRLLAAVCFALFGAMVVAVISHQVGAHTWRYLHRTSPLLGGPSSHKRVLVAAWAILAMLSALMGAAIFIRLQHEAASTQSGGSVGLWVAALIGFAGLTAPLAVGLVEAMRSSPEVLRRSALARIVQAANHDEHALARQVTGRRTKLVEFVEAGERLLIDTRRRVDAERLPAHQAILTLRARHGYADEYATTIAYPQRGTGFLPDVDHENQLSALVATLERMRATVAALPPASSPEDGDAPSVEGDALLVPGTSVEVPLGHNGNPVPIR